MNNTAKLDILDLISRASHTYDGQDPAAFAGLFTTSGLYQETRPGAQPTHVQGQQEIAAHAAANLARLAGSQARHHVRNTIFLALTSQNAVTHSYFLATLIPAQGGLAQLTATGLYQDELTLTPQGWRLASRHVVYD